MKEIKCPICNRRAKFVECICNKNGRKRIMLDFPCCHFSSLIYNVPYSTDNNTIIKDFQSISKDYFSGEPFRKYKMDYCNTCIKIVAEG